jgi:hypothetical protein
MSEVREALGQGQGAAVYHLPDGVETMKLPIGTRSLLFGVHQFVLHPLFLALAWWKLYGAPINPRLWVAFIVHDWGYWGKHDMDGDDGQTHPELGGRIMTRLFGPEWGDFTRLHSRYYAKRERREPSPLCAAAKLVLAVTPIWLYLMLARASGEVAEYMSLAARHNFYTGSDIREWHALLRSHWIDEARRLAPAHAHRLEGVR